MREKAPTSRRPRGRFGRRGMTLVELTLSVAISAGITVTVGHVVVQMSRGVRNLESSSQARTEAFIALQRMQDEMRYATSFIPVTGNRICFSHPDLTGDGVVDTVRYVWTGNPGDPVTRQLNQEAPEDILENCQSIAFTTISDTASDQLLAGHRTFRPDLAVSTTTFQISSSRMAAQCFKVIHNTANSFKVTRVRIYLQPLSTSGGVTVSIRTTSGNNPTSTVLDSAIRPVAQITTGGGWEEFSFANHSGLSLNTSYAIVVSGSASTANAAVTYDTVPTTSNPHTNDYYRQTTNGGSSWTPSSSITANDLRYQIYGQLLDGSGNVIAAASTALPVSSVRIDVSAGAAANPVKLSSSVTCVNRPDWCN